MNHLFQHIQGHISGAFRPGLVPAGQSGGAAFSPLSRFAAGEQGIWVDLNDFSTLWQDTARTVPVTAAGQTVKGITDKSGRGNHLTNATGWVLTADGSNNYLAASGASHFSSASFAWGSDKASAFFAAKKTSGVQGGIVSFGSVSVGTGAFSFEYASNDWLAYRRGSGSFGARQTTVTVNDDLLVLSGLLDLSGSTHATQNPFLRVFGTNVDLSTAGTANSGSGNFGTQILTVGSGVGGRLTGRIYSFFVVAATSTAAEMAQGELWVAGLSGQSSLLPLTAMPAATFMDTGALDDQTLFIRTSPFAHADYQTTATKIAVTGYRTTTLFPELAVYVDGVYSTSIIPAVNNAAFTALVTLSAGDKLVSFRNGLTTAPDGSFNFLGTWFTGATANAAATVVSTTPTNRLLIYGDSIAVGANATLAAKDGWAMLVRDAYAPDSVAVEGFGFRALSTDAYTAGLLTAFVAKMVAYNPSIIWLAIGTNDYGLNHWNLPSSFGTAYGATLDALNAALPGVPIYAQTPIVRAAGTNAFGDTLQEYRDEIATAVSTRTSFCTLVDGTAILTLGDLADGVHPTTAGHALYAAAVIAELGI